MDNFDTLGVLKRLERGEINAGQADEALSGNPPVERGYVPRVDETGAPAWVRRLWFYPLIAGLSIVALGAWIIVVTMHANILWFLFGLPILLLGTLIVTVAASAQSGHWLYVNINPGDKHRHAIRFGIPFPLGIIRGGLALAGFFGIRPRANVNVNRGQVNFGTTWGEVQEFVDALERELKEGRGVTVDVNDRNERVQVYIV